MPFVSWRCAGSALDLGNKRQWLKCTATPHSPGCAGFGVNTYCILDIQLVPSLWKQCVCGLRQLLVRVTPVKSSVSSRHLLFLYDWGPHPALAAPAASGVSFHQQRKPLLIKDITGICKTNQKQSRPLTSWKQWACDENRWWLTAS